MYPLTSRECAAERAEAQAEDARERLAMIFGARNDALRAMARALDEFIEELDRHRIDGRDVPEKERRDVLEAMAELLGEVAFEAVRDLEEYELGEGRHDLAAAADEDADRRARERREEG